MSLLGWIVGLSVADQLFGEANEREERQQRENEALRRQNYASEQRIAKLERELRDLKYGRDRRW